MERNDFPEEEELVFLFHYGCLMAVGQEGEAIGVWFFLLGLGL
jgi:hypothetical protein